MPRVRSEGALSGVSALRTRGPGSRPVMGRIRRSERRQGVRVVLGKRDTAVIRAVGRFRLCRTHDLLRLFFRGIRRDTALRRLRRLHDAGFLDVFVAALHEENSFALGPAGRRFVEAEGLAASPAPKGGEDHHLAIVGVWTSLAAAVGGGSDVRLIRFEPDWVVRRRMAGTDPRLVPDALIELAVGPTTVSRWTLEVDLGHERAAEFRRKLLAYSAEVALGTESMGLAVVLCDAGARRRAIIANLVQEYWAGAWLICLQDEWPQALLSILRAPLTDSPCGDGGAGLPSLSEKGQSDSQGEVHLR